ncbi:Rv3235 family protein [Streptomyces sp. LP05-1]|uniref:Rv3235 family protein n=1 Tax=Streptomyces pyxinae TaxID=2970734 RepID=A0ABT2CF41_9ACTN|nr:Rv3235 family protein [Streptomyces sp. LP05-1]MCS0636029.1 Rv3235 family protein [Streptomyces sp. LP05-1]
MAGTVQATVSPTSPSPARGPVARPGSTRPGGRRDQRRPGGARPPRRPVPPHVLFAERLIAVLTGERPVHWMLGQTVGAAYEQLARLAPAGPPAAPGVRPVLRRCGAAPLGPDLVEAYASVTAGGRVRAMAFRLERGPDRRWRCSAVDLGPAGWTW